MLSVAFLALVTSHFMHGQFVEQNLCNQPRCIEEKGHYMKHTAFKGIRQHVLKDNFKKPTLKNKLNFSLNVL